MNLIKETIMETENKTERDTTVVYRKDGKTPDLRYKSSRDFVLSQLHEQNKRKKKEGTIPDFRYKSLRDHVLTKQTGINEKTPVQIKPVGKKPVWKSKS
jgi:hypothetical protein